jgi:chromosome segregation ATPase
MKTLKFFGKVAAVPVILWSMLSVVAGKSVPHSVAHVEAVAQRAFDGLINCLPIGVRDKARNRELRQARSEIVDWRVRLILSERKLEQLRAEREKLVGRVARSRQLLAESYQALKAAIRDGQSTVRFAGSMIPIVDFQKEIDGLLSRRALDKETLAVTEQGLARLEEQHNQAAQALTAAERALETAEHEIEILKARRDHAAIVARTTELVTTISEGIYAPHAAIADAIEELRNDVAAAEARNQAAQIMISTDLERPGEMLTRAHARLGELQKICAEEQAQRRAKLQAAAVGAFDPANVAADPSDLGCGR